MKSRTLAVLVVQYPYFKHDVSGFHEAVGDTIALSVSTPQHLEKVGLLENYTDTEEDNINALMQIALQKVV
jgi:hypothetical protein